ncbi:hypothetical protein Dip518_001406 [Parelusimicrobium proximum]|uniref:hypothetical protein n=1 Tax=Parelusimicrobium proximum TaxID=3228953 RepID=UPI003D173F30
MKKIKLSGVLLILTAFVCGCGVVNNLNMVKNNFATGLTTHPYKVSDKDIDAVLASGKGIVDIYFAGDVQTVWKKVNEDGTVSKKDYYLTYMQVGSRGRRKSQLEPGTYFLNGYLFSKGNISYRRGTEANTLQDKNYGWDEENAKAYCFAFTLKPGQLLEIPDVIMTGTSTTGDSICQKFSFEDENISSEDFYIGDLSK